MALSAVSSVACLGEQSGGLTSYYAASITKLIPYSHILRVEPFVGTGITAGSQIWIREPNISQGSPQSFLAAITPAAFKTAWDANLV